MVQQPLPAFLSGEDRGSFKDYHKTSRGLVTQEERLASVAAIPNESSLHQQQLFSKGVQCTPEQEIRTRRNKGSCRKRRTLEGKERPLQHL